MIGIYKIENLLTGQTYIGQSKDIEQRYKEHLYHHNTPVGAAIYELGKEFFGFEVLELCDPDQLDEREEYYIEYYKSNVEGFGYNISKGGQHCRGESNGNVKLTEQEVYDIRESYNNHERKWLVYDKYKSKVTESYFSNVWEGRSWPNTHFDVYTEENKEYYMHQATNGENSDKALFTNEEVLELRQRYVNESARQIFESLNGKCKFQTLQMILWDRYYSDIPIYDKKNKKWIND